VDKRGTRLTGNLGVNLNKSSLSLIIVKINRVYVLVERIYICNYSSAPNETLTTEENQNERLPNF
jgi:hypothetical protein